MTTLSWDHIDNIFLDMDGTLLDLRFDNHFWLEFVPQRYARDQGIPEQEAKAQLLERYRSREGTLEWYCVDHWSRELGLDIVLLKEEVDHLVSVHPHVIDFLEAVQHAGKRSALVTNAHQKTLAFKLERTPLGGYFDNVVCSHDIGVPKEDPGFWPRLHAVQPFDPARTLFVDDSLAVLRAARDYGIRWLIAVVRPDSTQPPRAVDEFPAIRDFSSLIEGLKRGGRAQPAPDGA
jgi:HAD superfamily hydrolase (TIGR01509 family)